VTHPLPEFHSFLHRHIIFEVRRNFVREPHEAERNFIAIVSRLAYSCNAMPDQRCIAPEGEREAFAALLKRERLSRRQVRLAHIYRAFLYALAADHRRRMEPYYEEFRSRRLDPGGGMRHPDDWDEDGDW
jgi:hypothetical protein